MAHNRQSEPLLEQDNTRFTQLPIKYPTLQAAYKQHESMFWTADEIDYQADVNDFENLTKDEKMFVEHVLAFFAGADGIVLENLLTNFITEVQASEARNFYTFQAMIENVHGLVYSLLIDTYIKDNKRKDELFNAIDNIPCVAKKAIWAQKWINKDAGQESKSRFFEERLIAFAVVEGVFFSGSFCAIFWLKNRGKMVNALGTSNELIARDEGLHTDFAVKMYRLLNNKVSQDRAYEIFSDAVAIEKEFICESLPCRLIGMNSALMSDYIEFVADRLLVQLGFEKLYNTPNPFEFMNATLLDGKTNFFEKRVSEYQHSSVSTAKNKGDWEIEDDFEF
jgi:ribonucleotide reductase beta subunit family protein with ferritin-like domain